MAFQFDSPNYTQTPNQFFDELLAKIDSMAELKVTLAVMRYTFGYHRKSAEMSLSFLERVTGLTRPMVILGVRRGVGRGTITRDVEARTISLNVKPGSIDSILTAGIESKPKVVKKVYQSRGAESPRKFYIQGRSADGRRG